MVEDSRREGRGARRRLARRLPAGPSRRGREEAPRTTGEGDATQHHPGRLPGGGEAARRQVQRS